MPEPDVRPDDDDLAAIRARHTPWRDHRGRAVCAECAHSWPCDAARLLAALAAETAHWRAAEDDLAAMTARHAGLAADYDQAIFELTAAQERLEAAEVRLPTTRGGTLVVTAAELDAAWRGERELTACARFWKAGWRRAAYDFRDRGDVALAALERLGRSQGRLCAHLDPAAGVVEAARAVVAGADYRFPLADLREALAAYDAATEGGRP